MTKHNIPERLNQVFGYTDATNIAGDLWLAYDRRGGEHYVRVYAEPSGLVFHVYDYAQTFREGEL